MKILSARRFFTLSVILIIVLSTGAAQENKRYVRNPEKNLFGKSLNTKKARVKESPGVVRAKKKQAAAKKKEDKEYAAYVKRNREHSLKIQSPEVRNRMKENRKATDSNYKLKKKKAGDNTKKAGKKYGK
jgi:hypothetical protein